MYKTFPIMETIITNGVKISVEVEYQPTVNKMLGSEKEHIFAYRITIENQNSFRVQLLRRHWHICNALNMRREVEGPGVIGEQPVLATHAQHQYTSYCPLITDMGKMYGSFLMKNLEDDSMFRVEIPEFLMVLPQKLN